MRKFRPNHNKSSENHSFLRYFKARFQPFKKPLFWGSLGGGLLLAVCVWQYSQHPEWLDTTIEQPETSLNNPSEDSATTSLDFPEEGSPSAQNDLESFLELEAAGTALPGASSSPPQPELQEQLTPQQNQEAQPADEESAKIFPALLPNQNSSASDDPTISNRDLIERASFDNVRSFFEGSNSSQGSPSNLNSDQKVSPANSPSLPSVEPVPVAPSPLEQAVERVMSESELSQAPATDPEANASLTSPVPEAEAPPARPNFSESSIGTAGYEQYGTIPVAPNFSRPTPTPSPATPSYGTPGQSPYRQSTPPGVPNPPGVSAPPGLPATSPEEQLDSYNFNNSFTPPNIPRRQPNQTNNYAPAPQNGFEGNPSNFSGVKTPQYQQPIQIEQPEFSDSPF